ncbi:type VII secretion protein EccB [Segniliparus rugosus]|uniref:type VII secretion protein EccB n=1 Tax=Segniliparus rugosus TaxID=286804 RepID=UPI0001F040D7
MEVILSQAPGERPEPRRGFVTRHQVTGWRFTLRRAASGVALHDTRMLVEPLRSQSRAFGLGLLLLIAGVVGCFVFSLISPVGAANEHAVLADKATAALYVRLGDTVHPVLNLASARLIMGRAEDPTWVRGAELDQYRRGNVLGIPGAPERLEQSAERDAQWTVCDAAPPPAHGFAPTVTVIAGPLASGEGKAASLSGNAAVLARTATSAWLIWNGHRARIDLADHAVSSALGLGSDSPNPRLLSEALVNVIPEGPQLAVPAISGAGEQPRFALRHPVGSVVAARTLDGKTQNYAVLRDGLQPVPRVLAAILRNTNSYGLTSPPMLTPDQIARIPVVNRIDTSVYPADPVSVINPAAEPVLCARWAKPEGSAVSTLMLLSGAALPVDSPERAVSLVAAGAQGVADRVLIAPGTGYLVQIVGQEPASPTREARFWVSDTGVRYGLDTTGKDNKTLEALGLRGPSVAIPWSILRLLANGPTLSRADALLAHDSLPADPRPGRVPATEAGQ